MTQLMKSKKMIISYFLGLFLILSTVYFIVAYILEIDANKIRVSKAVSNEQYLLELEVGDLSGRVGRVVSDTLYLADRISILGSDEQALQTLKQDLISFINRKRVYDHIHLLDASGKELMRVNYYAFGSYATSSQGLNKKPEELPFFTQASAMVNGQVYISQLDLLSENGKVSLPVKPVITVSTPVFSQSKLSGVFAMSYNAKYMLNGFRNIAASSDGSVYLINADGYYLENNDDPDSEFAFMYEERLGNNFKAQYPAAWAEIAKAGSGSFASPEGYFIYTSVTPYNGYLDSGARLYESRYQLGEGNWIAVSYLSNANLKALGITTTFQNMVAYIFTSQMHIFLAMLLISLAASIMLAYNKASKDRVRYFSEYDVMTSTLNRRAGVNLLEKSCRDSVREQHRISVCFVDVDGLKQVNDRLGHEKGDELLIGVVSGIKKCIRQQDYVIRLGGDEFLIVFMRVDAGEAEAVWQRIREEYNRVNLTEHRPYLLSASHGIAEIHPNVKRMIDEVLNEADEKMYAEKRLARIGLNVLRE